MNTYMVVVGYEEGQSNITYRTVEIEAENDDEANYKVSATLSVNEWVEDLETVKIHG